MTIKKLQGRLARTRKELAETRRVILLLAKENVHLRGLGAVDIRPVARQIALAGMKPHAAVMYAMGLDDEKRTPWKLTLEWWNKSYGDEEENARARCCGREMQHALIAAGRRSRTANERKWATKALGVPAAWLQME